MGSSALSPWRASSSSRALKPALSSLILSLASWVPSWSTSAMSWWFSAQSMPQKILLDLVLLARALRRCAGRLRAEHAAL
ncbi:hypothetical protein ACWGHA_33850 [Streptomyces xanthophaeus]